MPWALPVPTEQMGPPLIQQMGCLPQVTFFQTAFHTAGFHLSVYCRLMKLILNFISFCCYRFNYAVFVLMKEHSTPSVS